MGVGTHHTWHVRIDRYAKTPDGVTLDHLPDRAAAAEWTWVDVAFERGEDPGVLVEIAARWNLDPMALRDAIDDVDLPKLDDFGESLELVLHGLRDDRVGTYEIDCFLSAGLLVTVHEGVSNALSMFGEQLLVAENLSSGGVDELLARLADIVNRRMLSVVHAFDDVADDLLEAAVAGKPTLLPDLVAVRRDVSVIRRSMQPQVDALADAVASDSPLVTEAGRRRFSDAGDVAARALHGLESARGVLSETLDAYRGAEARLETQVSKVLTIYAAIMLPLTLIVGFFGMNVPNLPWAESESGWWIIIVLCVAIASASLGVFVSLGWINRPSGRGAGRAIGHGLIEAARTPAQVAGALYEVVLTPLRRRR